MIGSLSGVLRHKQAPWLLLDVSGVGYELEAPMTTFYDLPEIGSKVELHTHLVVREDAQLLYGFSRLNQRTLFRNLLKVNGIGPRVALAILSTLNVEEFKLCIVNEDSVQLSRVPGIGKKTAQRLIIEMKDKLDDANAPSISEIAVDQDKTQQSSPISDAIAALVSLGYKMSDASKSIRTLDNSLTSEQLIREALKNMAKR